MATSTLEATGGAALKRKPNLKIYVAPPGGETTTKKKEKGRTRENKKIEKKTLVRKGGAYLIQMNIPL